MMGRAKYTFGVILLLLVTMVVGLASVASAKPRMLMTEYYINPAEVAIGGVQIGSSMDYVRSIYGEPTHVKNKSSVGPFGASVEWTYGDSFKITFGDGQAYDVETSANNGIKTPAGFTVGQNIDLVLNYFGKDAADVTKDGSKKQYRFRCASYRGMSFVTDKHGKIQKIYLWEAP